MALEPLSEAQFRRLLDIAVQYRREAKACYQADAPLAACIMMGAALEAALLASVHLCLDAVSRLSTIPHNPIEKWSLEELLNVARDLGWLSNVVAEGDSPGSFRITLYDYASWLRKVRNRVHPGRHIREDPDSDLTYKDATLAFRVVDVATLRVMTGVLEHAFDLRPGTTKPDE